MKTSLRCLLMGCMALACTPKITADSQLTTSPPEDPYLISIDGIPVPAEEFLYVLSKNSAPSEENKLVSSAEFEENFQLFINYKLKVTEAEKLGYHESEEFIEEFGSFREDIRKPFLLENEVQEGELQKAYSRLKEVVKASHILLSFPPNANLDDSLTVLRMANKIQAEASEGMDFSQLALTHSQDPSVETNRGNLGYFTAMQMVYPFEAATYNLQVGEVSKPILTDYGYHIIKLEDRRPNPGEIRVSHLLVRTSPDDEMSEDRAKRKVVDIYEQLLKENSTWEEIVGTFSEDPGTRQSGGLLPWFGVGSIVPEFEQAAFALQEIGEISNPVKTPFGYHIIRLEEVKPVAPYEELEQTLKSRILRDSRSTLIKSQVTAMQKAKYDAQENDSIFHLLAETFQQENNLAPESLKGKWEQRELWDKWVLRIGTDTLRVVDFWQYIIEESSSVKANKKTDLESWKDGFIVTQLNEAEERDLFKNNKDYRLLVQEFRDGILLFNLMNDLVWQKAINDSVGQRTYYEEHLDRYYWQERVPSLVVKITQPQNEEISKLRGYLQNKEYEKGLEKVLQETFLERFPLLFTLEDRLVETTENPIFQDLDLSKNFHEKMVNGIRYFILTGDKLPEGSKEFEETRGKVIQDYQTYLDETLINKLKEKYSIKINEGEKNRIYHLAVN
ncbi:peptidylprolyl isomerase [Lunatibacter salilacus]|uniref:peptidylprolyl isomerase n=1 Tax=Lunatibacter salilacus TaxID=2483804 RepID=UPI001F3C5E74|nr:peptidylprolyl isomerase [Lunatibacter salilacus]